MKKILSFSLLTFYFLLSTRKCFAQSQNIFGLHLTQTSDIHQAKDIINSSGGDWGWVTIVLRTDQLNHQTWQEFFDNCRRYHIIPLIRLATVMNNDLWRVPQTSDIDDLASFLHSLNWPTLKQHVVIFNEINHASEWGGGVDLKNYVDLALYAAEKLKSLNSNFFILPAALDLAAPSTPPVFESAPNVYRQILNYQPDFFNHFDGLASHSYPNHGFVGQPYQTGQHSVRGYQWEINFINKKLPVFITETGWPHREGQSKNHRYYSLTTAANFLAATLSLWQKDPAVSAVTPFIYNYPNPPFDHFSWIDQNEKLYPEYQKIVNLPKTKNTPAQITSYQLVKLRLPILIFTNTDYIGTLTLKNTGQSIWGETEFCLTPKSSSNITLDAICLDNNLIFPNQNHSFTFKFKVQPSNQTSSIAFENLPATEITPINSSGTIYRPKTGLYQTFLNLLNKIFP